MSIIHIESAENRPWKSAPVQPCTDEELLTLTGETRQTVLGFGGCFNELGWEALSLLSGDDRRAVLDDFFGDSLNLTSGRLPIGANDFSLEWYSCDETPDDLALDHFNIDRDRKYTIPFIREALKRCPQLHLFASPWSPPTWMKTHRAYNYGTMRMEPAVLDAYARYFVKFVQAYAGEGIEIAQIHVQNEPVADQKFPSCVWTGEKLRVFIRDYIGPAFRDAGLSTELWLGTINAPFTDYRGFMDVNFQEFFDGMVNTVLADPEARRYLTGVGLQWGGKHVLEPLEAAYPEMRVMQTESECGNGLNEWEQAEYIFTLMWQYFRHGAERYTYWNLALQDGGISTWGWKQNLLITVNPDSRTYRFQPEYYLMKHFSHFIQPGARFRPLRGHWASSALAFENPDGAIVLCACNGVGYERTLSFRCERGAFSCAIAPHTFHTFVLR